MFVQDGLSHFLHLADKTLVLARSNSNAKGLPIEESMLPLLLGVMPL